MSTIHNPSNLQVNLNSLIGQLTLHRTESGLARSIRNLSSGIQIHSGRDDPIGFVSSTMMQTNIVSRSQAVANCQRAGVILSTTDSSLSHISGLLNDLRGLVTQAANTGGENRETLKALQEEADAILSTIDFISNTTSFKDQKLIDGSLDFTTAGLDGDKVSHVGINQAHFLGRTEKDVSVQILEPPKRAELYYPLGALKNDVVLDIGGSKGYQAFSFDKDATVEQIADAVNRFSDSTGVAATVEAKPRAGTFGLTSYGKDNDIIITASEPGTEAGHFVFRYTAPKEGNDTLRLDVTEGSGNEPTVVEIILETESWKSAEYHYNGENDGISNNEFTISARQTGAEFNDVEFVFNNVFGTGESTGIDVDLKETPKKFLVNISYDASNPAAAGNTTVRDLESWIKADPTVNTYFELEHTSPSDGSGPLVPTSPIELSGKGVDGGAVLSTAEQVATLINTSQRLKDADGNGRVFASLPTGSTGAGTVSPFSEYAYYGDTSENNYLQFLAPENSPTIRFVSGKPGTPLSVDDTTDPPVYGYAGTSIQGFDPGTSFSIRALSPGPDGDQVGVIMRDAAEESVVFDAQRNAVVISVDFSGRAEEGDPRGSFNMNDLIRMVDEDPFVSSRFRVDPLSWYDPEADPPEFKNDAYRQINAKVGETSGGVLSEGTILIHLETDSNGIVKTTANDLVKYFNDPGSEESKAVLDRLGISVSNLDPGNSNLAVCTTGFSENGTGLLKPTDDPDDCVDPAGRYPDIAFTSSGLGIREDYPTATVVSQNGIDANFTITARQSGAAFNNTTIRTVSDPAGPSFQYNTVTKSLTIGLSPQQPLTAGELVELLNADPTISELFIATRSDHSTGEGTVAVGDFATLTGGIQAVDNRPAGTVVSSGGLDATFRVQAKTTDKQLIDTQVLVIADTNGPSVSYDPLSKQLTVGVDPLHPSTALDIVGLINSTPEVKDLFQASIPESVPGSSVSPQGTGTVQIGDRGTLRAESVSTELGAPMIGNSDGESLGITFHAVEYGSGEFVSVIAALGTDFPLTDRYGNVAEKTYGTDVKALINGEPAIGKGRVASIANSDLDLSIWLDSSVRKGDVTGFRITGGGALLQLGPDPVANQQARISIGNMHSNALGGIEGRLSQLRTGGPYDLSTDTSTAFRIVEEVTREITSLQGRLGAFQKNQVEANMNNMVDAIEIESGALSEIRDTDFAAASSDLARQQLLMQTNVTALQLSSQTMQMLLGLLQR